MKISLENRGRQNCSDCNKFYELVDARYGLIGSIGKTLVVSAGSLIERTACFNKLVKAKTGRKNNPYIEIGKTQPKKLKSERKFGFELEVNTKLSKLKIKNLLQDRGVKIHSSNQYFVANGI